MTATALVIAVPEVESLTRGFRLAYDPVASQGVSAHVTLLGPFLEEIDAAVIADLQELFRNFDSFHFRLGILRRFSSMLYLQPEPDLPFRRLTEELFAAYPECPPYGDASLEVIPHLTLGRVPPGASLDQLEAEFHETVAGLPVECVASTVTLLEKHRAVWQERVAFRLGPTELPTNGPQRSST